MKNTGFKILYIITAIVVVVNLCFAVWGSLFTDISQLPEGRLINRHYSPSREKIMNIYLVENDLGVAIRGEIVTHEGKHNVFWQTDIDQVHARWINENTVMINDIPLDANDTFGYDCRRGYSLFDEGSLEQNFMHFKGNHEEK